MTFAQIAHGLFLFLLFPSSTMHLHLDHLAEALEGLSDSCDMLLKLDDGSALQAHSPVLARCSPVLLWHVHEGPLASAPAQNKAAVPLMECETNVAIKLLTVVLSHSQQRICCRDL